MIKDFSKYKRTNTYYGGSEKKFGILIDGYEYLVKFQKTTNLGTKRLNHVSEYLGSHIFSLLGFNVQETFLGLYNKEQVVVCKNFISDGYQFVPFNDVGESSLERDKEAYQYSYQDITDMLLDNIKLTDVEETIKSFWEIFIVDAIIGNFDRHGSNWGFLKKSNKYTLAPIFDNDSCLFPQLIDDEEIIKIMNSQDLTDQRIYKFPTSQIQLNDKKSSYFEVINSLRFPECNKALTKIYKIYSQEKIDELIDETLFINDTHRAFYKYILKQRFDKIILASYRKLMEIKDE